MFKAITCSSHYYIAREQIVNIVSHKYLYNTFSHCLDKADIEILIKTFTATLKHLVPSGIKSMSHSSWLLVMMVFAGFINTFFFGNKVTECNVFLGSGKVFNRTNIIGSHVVQCDTMPEPKDRCCLPQEKHLACYDIM